MLIEGLFGLVAFRRGTLALVLGRAMGEPLFSGVVFSLAARGTLARDPQIDDLSHARARRLPIA